MPGSIRIDIVTALPALVEEPLQHSILQRAQESDVATLQVHNLREYATDKHRQVDDRPFGGGAGMVLKPEPLFRAVEAIEGAAGEADDIIYLTPDGARLDQPMANRLSMEGHLILIAGHYKGIDQRVRDLLVTREVSIGDVVLSGGELPALMLVDAVVRLVPGALGDSSSALTDAFQDGLLGAPVYTRPAEFRGHEVPSVLRSGDHQAIARWRDEKRLEKTRDRRPDLLPDTNNDSTEASSQ
ncbi:tRNA (guanosine(37)-N1)-methyltransferase TrmD [Salinibacter ruber]|uniref:tRNA (guanosine(37)-N1)-methyltransferase TrmD n=1 Tax=Salinibacter ruber TaxID=146919 RepID=UPI0021670442|nr:tRNA (guanosine(37)-N1)-methyltransferase TrmD [Salinibacter ruber]MCS3756797.1 tRNA (guanine37-N1)-methyltransferase [Salinibacter ruber]MCS3953653.1 tRNA (guanine37-N1)-methyltransferase [Salinibacter ruber]MCS4087130.1 tRNA (guanine37-N1)-methyltransferase [Salinibacter ruber]